MKKYKIQVIENITGVVEIAADSLFVAENIARSTLHDEGTGAFPDLRIISRETEADGLFNHDETDSNEEKED